MRTRTVLAAGIAVSLAVASPAAASPPAAHSGGGPSGLIAFTRDHRAHVMNADGSGIHAVGCGGVVNDVAWSPDGQKLACGGSRGIVVVSADGSDATRVSTRVVLSLSWSPDGGRILFSYAGRPARGVVFDVSVMNADGSNVRQLTHTPKLWENNVDWSPGGGLIVFDRGSGWGRGHVCVMKADGSGLRDLNPVRRGQFEAAWQSPYEVFSQEPDWSPDGRRIAFSYLDPYYGLGDIWIMDAKGKGLVKLTHNWMEDGSPDWSPDGRQVAFVRSARGASKSQIVLMNADGTGKKALTSGEFADRSPAWQPVAS